MPKQENDLGRDDIGRLVLRIALPSICLLYTSASTCTKGYSWRMALYSSSVNCVPFVPVPSTLTVSGHAISGVQ